MPPANAAQFLHGVLLGLRWESCAPSGRRPRLRAWHGAARAQCSAPAARTPRPTRACCAAAPSWRSTTRRSRTCWRRARRRWPCARTCAAACTLRGCRRRSWPAVRRCRSASRARANPVTWRGLRYRERRMAACRLGLRWLHRVCVLPRNDHYQHGALKHRRPRPACITLVSAWVAAPAAFFPSRSEAQSLRGAVQRRTRRRCWRAARRRGAWARRP